MLAGSLGYYSLSLDLATGSVSAKEFIFLGEGTESFQTDALIAPSEKMSWPFKVKNYDQSAVTQTGLQYQLTITVTASKGKEAIEPLEVRILNSEGQVLNSLTGIGVFTVNSSFPLQANGQFHDYSLEIRWPEKGSNDIGYAGRNYGNTITVSATATQTPPKEG
jgi:hypothetical protein